MLLSSMVSNVNWTLTSLAGDIGYNVTRSCRFWQSVDIMLHVRQCTTGFHRQQSNS